LAGDIADYGHHDAPVFYGAITKIADAVNAGTLTDDKAATQIDMICTRLAKDAQANSDKVDQAMKDISSFIVQIRHDKGALAPIHARYVQEYEGQAGLITQFTQEVEDDKNLIDSFNKEYRKDVTIACTSATYAWVFPAGTIAAAVVAGVYGKRAQDALDHVHEYQDKRASTEDKLRAAILLKHDFEFANQSLDGLISDLNAAMPVLEKAKGIWGALADDLKNINATIKNNPQGVPAFIASLSVDVAIQQWKDLADAADQYRVNAYITVKSEADIKANPPAMPPLLAAA
jgi:hypothetical protein